MPEKQQKPVDVTKCPTKVTAVIFGCSEQHLRNLSAKGAIKQTARGKYDLAAVASYMLQANEEDLAPIQKAKLETELEKARRQKRLNDEEAGKLVRVDDVQEFVHGYTGELIQMIETIKKSTGALLDNDTRKTFYKKCEDARTAMADRFKTYVDNSLSINKTK